MANIKTSILFASKKKDTSNYKIFTGIIENIGFDSNGKEIEGADWQQVAEKFNQSIGDWKVSRVTNMEAMFYKAYEFN